MKGILGVKVGMTEKFTKDGKIIPVTIVEVQPNVITQIKTVEKDGYNAIQLAVVDKKEKNATKAEIGHAKKAGVAPKRFLKELRVESTENYTLGSTLAADTFEVGEKVDVTGTSKGKGFQGVIKRHNQSRGPMSHGSQYHRGVGSMGTMLPMRVLPGKKLPGHMGHVQVTIQNLEVVKVDLENNVILIKGSVPGPKNSLVLVRTAVKAGDKAKEPVELIVYEDGTSSEEVIEETIETINDELAETNEETSQEASE